MSAVIGFDNTPLGMTLALGSEAEVRDSLPSKNARYDLLRLAFSEQHVFHVKYKEFLHSHQTEQNRAAVIHLFSLRNIKLNGIKFRGEKSKLEYNRASLLTKGTAYFKSSPKFESQCMMHARMLEVKKAKLDALGELEFLKKSNYYREMIIFYMREDNKEKAKEMVDEALRELPKKGIFWQLKLQLIDDPADENKFFECFSEACRSVPKSGEIWCEFARLLMNSCSKVYDLDLAESVLNTAIKNDPSYGDSYIEFMRLKLLKNESVEPIISQCLKNRPNYGIYWIMCRDPYLTHRGYTIRRALKKITGPVDSIGRSYHELSCAFSMNHRSFHEQKKAGQLSQEAIEFLLR